MELLLKNHPLPFLQYGDNIFTPISLKTTIIKQFLSSVIFEITKFISFINEFIYEIFKKEHDSISKIYKFIFDFNSFSFANFIHTLDFYKIIVFALIICFTIYLYETFEKWNDTIKEMNITIKQLQIENELLNNHLSTYSKKNTIIADEIDTIHSEVVKCIKKIRKIENQVKNLDY